MDPRRLVQPATPHDRSRPTPVCQRGVGRPPAPVAARGIGEWAGNLARSRIQPAPSGQTQALTPGNLESFELGFGMPGTQARLADRLYNRFSAWENLLP